MAKTKQPRKKTSQPDPHTELRTPNVGERVMLGNSESVYNITRASADSRDVDLQLPATNIYRFRVPVEELRFVDVPQASPRKPAKPAINVEEIRERITTAQQSSVEQFSGDIAVLKKYLKSTGIEDAALEELDSLCKDMEKRWRAAVEAIEEMLEE